MGHPGFLIGAAGLTALLLAACGPEPTPLPVVSVATATPQVTISPADAPAMPRYTVDSIAARAMGPDLGSLRALGDVTIGPADSQSISIVSQPVPGSQPLPHEYRYALRTDLSDDGLSMVLSALLDAIAAGGPPDVATFRASLADAGYPDGVELRGDALPDDLIQLLSRFGVRVLPADDDVPALIAIYAGDQSQDGDIRSFALTLYALAADGHAIVIQPESGLPIAAE